MLRFNNSFGIPKHKPTVIAGLLLATFAFSNCTKKSDDAPADAPQTTNVQAKQTETPGVMIPSGNLPAPNSVSGEIAYLGGVIVTRSIQGRVYVPIEGTFSDASFNNVMETAAAQSFSDGERQALLLEEVNATVGAIKKTVTVAQVNIKAEVGYFSALIPLEQYSQLSSVTGLSRRLLINPVVSIARDPSTRGFAAAEGIALGVYADKAEDGRATTDSYSGLERIGVDEFLAATKKELGQDVDGSKVNVGVTDTGVTLNHPAFLNSKGESRITYLKDFTGEGQMYFPSTYAFATREPTADELPKGVDPAQALIVTAQVLVPTAGTTVPDVNQPTELKNQLILVTPELKKALLSIDTGARLGVFSEAAFDSTDGSEVVDLNHNGKHSDMLYAILLPNADVAKSQIFFDMSGRGDFRKSPALSDWNTTHTTQTVFSEKFGLEIKSTKLPAVNDTKIDTVLAAIVGFDPGNHGSHVSGIIGGRKTIANDSDQTKARGVAPNTNLMVNRVCANNGGCGASEAMIDLSNAGAEVINMSLGGLSPFNDGYGVQETIANRLTMLNNTLFVISAGNSGPGRQTVGSPSVARLALSVAATGSRKLIERQYQYLGFGAGKPSPTGSKKDDDFVMFFSSRGPTAAGGFKPNVAAPGTELSAIQLNSAPGSRSGLDVYWGTSMAAPTTTGAVALLLDAAKRYNELHADAKLPIDPVTIHRALSESAIAFDMNSFAVRGSKRSLGQYTWIDQGNGMINLLSAWNALKAERSGRLASAVQIDLGSGKKESVSLDYDIRVLRKSPNGIDYTGTQLAPVDTNGAVEPRFGRGIYLDINGNDSLIPVQVTRRLPLAATRRADAGELNRQLVTTADKFSLETTVYGSAVQWLKAGTFDRQDCLASPTSELLVVGAGAIDNFDSKDPAGRSTAFGTSTLQVCVDRKLINTLAPGDHGALIKAYRIVDGKKEISPSFVVPLYIAVPHATLAAKAGYQIKGSVKSFGLDRHYVQIPAGTSLVKVTLEVPEAKTEGTVVSGCAGVELMALEGGNTVTAPEISPRAKARASNCERSSGASNAQRIVSYTRFNPKAGIWDLHVFGQYSFADSPYTLTVEFAKVASSIAEIKGTPDKLNGSLDFSVVDASIAVIPSEAKSVFGLSTLIQDVKPKISEEEDLSVPSLENVVARSYDESVAAVTFTTGGLPGSDLDLTVKECSDKDGKNCKTAGVSGGATDEESVTISPVKGKFYVPVVSGYKVEGEKQEFKFSEIRKLAKAEAGKVKVTSLGDQKFKIDYSFDIEKSAILKSELFTSGNWAAGGDLTLKADDGAGLIRLPVKITVK